jgi:hypothetical protein
VAARWGKWRRAPAAVALIGHRARVQVSRVAPGDSGDLKLLFFEGEIVTLLRRGRVFKLFCKELLKSNRVEKRFKYAFLLKE